MFLCGPLKPGDPVYLLCDHALNRPMVIRAIMPEGGIACMWLDKDGKDCFGLYDQEILGREFDQTFDLDVKVVRLELFNGECPEISETLFKHPGTVFPTPPVPISDRDWAHLMGDDDRAARDLVKPGNWTEIGFGNNPNP